MSNTAPTRLPSIGAEPSQADIVLECLQRRKGRWVAMPKLASISGSMAVHSLVAQLRKKGFNIINDQRTRRDARTRDSFYRLVEAEEQPTESTPS